MQVKRLPAFDRDLKRLLKRRPQSVVDFVLGAIQSLNDGMPADAVPIASAPGKPELWRLKAVSKDLQIELRISCFTHDGGEIACVSIGPRENFYSHSEVASMALRRDNHLKRDGSDDDF